jgi:integrase
LRFQIQKKRKKDPPKWLTIPILPDLQVEINRAPKDSLTFLTTAFGRPFTSNGFGNWFKKRCREAGITEGSAHGLRKAGAVIATENGATDAQLQAIFGWDTVKMAEHYRKKARQERLAADGMHLIRLPVSKASSEVHDKNIDDTD